MPPPQFPWFFVIEPPVVLFAVVGNLVLRKSYVLKSNRIPVVMVNAAALVFCRIFRNGAVRKACGVVTENAAALIVCLIFMDHAARHDQRSVPVHVNAAAVLCLVVGDLPALKI